MPRIALVTAQEVLGLDQDLEPLLEALRMAGAQGEAVCWDADKHYLVDLDRAGVAVVPTRFAETREDAGGHLEALLLRGELSVGRCGGFEEFVIKPAVGAGSKDAARYEREEAGRALVERFRISQDKSLTTEAQRHGGPTGSFGKAIGAFGPRSSRAGSPFWRRRQAGLQ